MKRFTEWKSADEYQAYNHETAQDDNMTLERGDNLIGYERHRKDRLLLAILIVLGVFLGGVGLIIWYLSGVHF